MNHSLLSSYYLSRFYLNSKREQKTRVTISRRMLEIVEELFFLQFFFRKEKTSSGDCGQQWKLYLAI